MSNATQTGEPENQSLTGSVCSRRGLCRLPSSPSTFPFARNDTLIAQPLSENPTIFSIPSDSRSFRKILREIKKKKKNLISIERKFRYYYRGKYVKRRWSEFEEKKRTVNPLAGLAEWQGKAIGVKQYWYFRYFIKVPNGPGSRGKGERLRKGGVRFTVLRVRTSSLSIIDSRNDGERRTRRRQYTSAFFHSDLVHLGNPRS